MQHVCTMCPDVRLSRHHALPTQLEGRAYIYVFAWLIDAAYSNQTEDAHVDLVDTRHRVLDLVM